LVPLTLGRTVHGEDITPSESENISGPDVGEPELAAMLGVSAAHAMLNFRA
jgi:hypothetical protein